MDSVICQTIFIFGKEMDNAMVNEDQTSFIGSYTFLDLGQIYKIPTSEIGGTRG
jgi:hypothetical protein